jgi:hypothetical protein
VYYLPPQQQNQNAQSHKPANGNASEVRLIECLPGNNGSEQDEGAEIEYRINRSVDLVQTLKGLGKIFTIPIERYPSAEARLIGHQVSARRSRGGVYMLRTYQKIIESSGARGSNYE